MKTGYCTDYEYKKHPAGISSSRAHFNTLAPLKKHLKDAVSEGSIKKESIRVYKGWHLDKADITEQVLQTIKF